MESLKEIAGTMMNNIRELELDSKDTCPICGEKTTMEIEILGQIRLVPRMCSCKRQEYKRQEEEGENKQKKLRLERLRQYSLMDKRFEEYTFENFKIDKDNKKIYEMAIRYCQRWNEMKAKNVGFLFYGPPGTGKTYLAFCIANELIKKEVPIIAISTIGLLNKIKETYNKYGQESEVDIINIFKNASLLVIDDLGAENDSGWVKEKLYEIIDSRYRDGKPMIVTTNLTLEQLKDKLTGEDGVTRTYDRLIEMCYPVLVMGESKRVKKTREKEDIIKDLLS